MPIVVTAVFYPIEGKATTLTKALSSAISAVHREDGCLLYALHAAEDGTVVLVEKWRSAAELERHGSGHAVQQLNYAIADLTEREPVVVRMKPIFAGDPEQGLL